MSCHYLKALYLAVEKKLTSEICPRVGICKSPELMSFAEGLLQDQNKADAKHSRNPLSQQSARLTGLSWQWFGYPWRIQL